MSSPLSMLKKTRRTPLQGHQDEQWGKHKVPFRRNVIKEFQAALVADGSSSLASHPPASSPPSKAPLKKAAPPTDFELMSAMVKRVTQLEETVRSQAEAIEHKDKRISVLEEKLKKQSGSVSSDRDDLKRRCQQLQNQVNQMEGFLSNCGWGLNGETSVSAKHEQTQKGDLCQPEDPPGMGFHMDFDLVLQRIRDLNILAGEDESFVQMTATGAQLAKKDPVPLRLYGNGIVMFDGPFRSYGEQSTQQCMQDLMDGYYPSELQERFPDGVLFEVHDRRHEEFIFRMPWDTFPGDGQAVCGEKNGSAISSQTPNRKLTTEQFLNKLPKLVVKAGQVIDIRDSLRATLQGSPDAQRSSSEIFIDSSAMQAMTDRQASSHDVITLRVKSEDGDHTYIVKMCLSETVGDLRRYLDKHRGDLAGYDIISAYPQCCYSDDSKMLNSCGLTMNATLLLQKRKQSQNGKSGVLHSGHAADLKKHSCC